MSPTSISAGHRLGFQVVKYLPPRLHAADVMKFSKIKKFYFESRRYNLIRYIGCLIKLNTKRELGWNPKQSCCRNDGEGS